MSCTGPPQDDQLSRSRHSSRTLTLSGVKATKAIHTAGLLGLPFHMQLTHGTYIRTQRVADGALCKIRECQHEHKGAF